MVTDIHGGSLYRLVGKARWPLFGREVKVSFGKGTDVSSEYAEKCVSQLLSLDAAGIEQLLKASIRFFRDAEWCHGEPPPFMFEFEDMEYPQISCPISYRRSCISTGRFQRSTPSPFFPSAHGNRSTGCNGSCEMEGRCMSEDLPVLAPTQRKASIWKPGKRTTTFSTNSPRPNRQLRRPHYDRRPNL